MSDCSRIEAALLSASFMEDCAVRARRTVDGGRDLVAYIVSSDPLDPERLRTHLGPLLPPELLPETFVPLESLPLTAEGKVDDEAIARLPVVTPDRLEMWEKDLRGLPGIEEVAIVMPARAETLPPVHLADLIPHWQEAGHLPEAPGTVTITPSQDGSPASLAPAISDGGTLVLSPDAPMVLAEALVRAARGQTGQGVVYLQPDGHEICQSYAELQAEASRILAGLRRLGLRPQDKVIFQLDLNQDFIPAFWGCVLGGFVPVPVSIPISYHRDNSTVKKLFDAWQSLSRPLVLCSARPASALQGLAKDLDIPEDFRVATIEEARSLPPDSDWHRSEPDDLALLLLTSGSTGKPKAVMQSHRSLLNRSAGDAQDNDYSAADITLNWMPLDHVGGIVFFHLRDVFLGCRQIHVPTEVILQNPLRWWDLVDRYRVTVTWAPNFAFALVNDQAEKLEGRRWDLSCMRYILNGGEAVVARTARRFLELLLPCGLSETAMHPVWGMSETSSGSIYNHRFSRATSRDEDPFVEVGTCIPGMAMRIVDPLDKTRVLREGEIGDLQVKGLPVTSGYYGLPEMNREVFTEDGWFITGDLGVIRHGSLAITGRDKDLIIINGTNYPCHEIEAVVESVKGVEVSFTASCAVRVPGRDTDQLAIFFHPASEEPAALVALIHAIREKVVGQIGVNPNYLIPVGREEIPKTAIGKIQRSQLKKRFEAGEFNGILKRLDLELRNANTLPDWFFCKAWRRKEIRLAYSLPHGEAVLIFMDSLGLGSSLGRELTRLGVEWIGVERGQDYARPESGCVTLDPGNPDHLQQFFESLAAGRIRIGQIIHLWTYTEYSPVSGAEAVLKAQELGLYSVLLLAGVLPKVRPCLGPAVRLLVVSSYLQAVRAGERVAYEKSPVLGLLKAIPRELTWMRCRHLDFAGGEAAANAGLVLQEMQDQAVDQEVAFRDGDRWVAFLENAHLSQRELRPLPFKEEGVYLITGGLGGIGVEIARSLLSRFQARLLLIGRTPLPEREEWEEAVRRGGAVAERIRTLQAMERLGGEVLYRAVDVCDLDRLRQVVGGAVAPWGGRIHGVIHLAGAYVDRLLAEETPASLNATLYPKVVGACNLQELLREEDNPLFLCFSSVLGFFGGAAVGAYAAANTFLDYLILHQRSLGLSRSYCFAWSGWEDLGLSREYGHREAAIQRGFYDFSTAQGLHSLLAGLHRDQAGLLIGLDANNPKIRRVTGVIDPPRLSIFFAGAARFDQGGPAPPDLFDRFGTRVPFALVKLPGLPRTAQGGVDRAALTRRGRSGGTGQEERVAPGNDLERLIARIWQEVLRVPQIGVHDNFFELGGDSIKGAIVVNKLQEEIGSIFHVVALFNAPTIARLSAFFKENYAEAVARLIGEGRHVAAGAPRTRVGPEQVAGLRRLIPSLPPRPASIRKKNPPVVFVLSPPRSGSTLLRVILGGHPDLFAPPELYLQSFPTLAARSAVFSGPQAFWGEGLIRAVMEIRHCDAAQARELVREQEERDLSVPQFYGLLQSWLGKRTLVDKTPTYSLDPATLGRIEEDFNNPLYLHLVRHPYGMIRSFDEARLEQLLYSILPSLRGDAEADAPLFTRLELAELIWLASQENILEFLGQVPARRQCRVRFEDLVSRPGAVVEEICRFLGLAPHPDMLQPYQEKKQRMTDGIHEASRMLGDIKFHAHQGIEAGVASRWQEVYREDFIGDRTWQVAQILGYQRDGLPAPDRRPPETIRRLSRRGPDKETKARLDGLSDQDVDRLLREKLARQRKDA